MNIADVTVVTPTIAHRHDRLIACMESVRNQTVLPRNHLVGVDFRREGPSATFNRLIRSAQTEWIIPLCDDDILYPNYIERLIENAGDADMIYPWCNVVGRNRDWNPNSYFDADRLMRENYIPATVLLRKSVWAEMGEYQDSNGIEDWLMWISMVQNNKSIKCLPEILWEYRFHESNISNGIDPKDV